MGKKPGLITVYHYLSKGFGEKSVYDGEFLRCWGRGCQAFFGDQLAFFASHGPEAKQLLFFGDASDKGVEKGLATFNLRHGNHHELSFNYFLPLSVKEVGVLLGSKLKNTTIFFVGFQYLRACTVGTCSYQKQTNAYFFCVDLWSSLRNSFLPRSRDQKSSSPKALEPSNCPLLC